MLAPKLRVLFATSTLVALAIAGCASTDGEDDANSEASEIRSSAPAKGKLEAGKIYKVTADGLRIRKDGKIGSTAIGLLPLGTKVKLITGIPSPDSPNRSVYNVEVVTSKQKGWVDGDYLVADSTTTNPPVVGSCTALSKCCGDLKSAGFDDTECRKTVTAANDSTCAATQTKHVSFGDCTAASSKDGGTAGAACQALSLCCADLKSAGFDDSECKRTAAAANESTCSSTQARHLSFGDCKAASSTVSNEGGAPGVACKALSLCCADLKSAGFDDSECKRTAAATNESTCSSTQARHVSFGDCKNP